MSAEMDPEIIEQTEEPQEPLKAVESGPEGQVEQDKKTSELMERIRKLDRQNTDLRKSLEKKERSEKSVEERLAIIEREREEANERARTVEAFADAGLGETWRKVFEEKDPFARADKVRELLKEHEREVAVKMASDLGTADTPEVKGGKPMYTTDDLKNMSEEEINRAFKEGRVQGM